MKCGRRQKNASLEKNEVCANAFYRHHCAKTVYIYIINVDLCIVILSPSLNRVNLAVF